MRVKLTLVLAIIMGLITTALFFSYMKKFDAAQAVDIVWVEVIAARQPIMKNQSISADMLYMIQVPEKGLHPQTIKSTEEAEGKFAVADLAAGEVLLSHRLRQVEEETMFVSRKIQEGYRAVTVEVNAVQSVSNLIEPEDYVDVISTPAVHDGKPAVSFILLERVRVLAIGRRMVEAGPDTQYEVYSSVTLELKPQDAVMVINAGERGSLSLILHSRMIPAA
ncbi:Flp pilus assembly protein CpaB [Paenibacillus abyssi]|uniref:Flp pilus assembly protein CpaB n=1 Tax=Paenibacillus abyssi TaxID=1340531 RepID=A0A917FSW7_9BACL|nr:Flp pilus assembly protein CpaB [Paenibacillus abyssi]GGG00546.1 Flp pilus assembly protein CpaB [Paenibacillus abyssi]